MSASFSTLSTAVLKHLEWLRTRHAQAKADGWGAIVHASSISQQITLLNDAINACADDKPEAACPGYETNHEEQGWCAHCGRAANEHEPSAQSDEARALKLWNASHECKMDWLDEAQKEFDAVRREEREAIPSAQSDEALAYRLMVDLSDPTLSDYEERAVIIRYIAAARRDRRTTDDL